MKLQTSRVFTEPFARWDVKFPLQKKRGRRHKKGVARCATPASSKIHTSQRHKSSSHKRRTRIHLIGELFRKCSRIGNPAIHALICHYMFFGGIKTAYCNKKPEKPNPAVVRRWKYSLTPLPHLRKIPNNTCNHCLWNPSTLLDAERAPPRTLHGRLLQRRADFCSALRQLLSRSDAGTQAHHLP
jgi:hypothetical protein